MPRHLPCRAPNPHPAPADLHWVVQAGWTDPAHGGVGAAYTEALREALVPLSAASAPYINAVDTAEGARCGSVGPAGAADVRHQQAPSLPLSCCNITCPSPPPPLPALHFVAPVKGLSYAEAADKVGGAANLERLRAVKARVDPGNVFQATAHTKVLAARAP